MFFWKKNQIAKAKQDYNLILNYKKLTTVFKDDFQQEKVIIESLEPHLNLIDQLDKNLSKKIQDFWTILAPKMRAWLLDIKKELSKTPEKIRELQKDMGECEEYLSYKYQNLIEVVIENDKRWRNIGTVVILKILALQDVTIEIANLQHANQDSTEQISKIILDYKIYKKNVEKVLENCRVQQEFERRVRQELDKAIADISPTILELVNKKIIENIKSIRPRAELLFEAATSFEHLEKAEEIGDMKVAHDRIVEAFQKFNINTLDVELGLEEITIEPDHVEYKIEEVMNILDSKIPTISSKNQANPEHRSFEEYQKIVREMGITENAMVKIYNLFDEYNNFNERELDHIARRFSNDRDIMHKISKHPKTNNDTLKYIIMKYYKINYEIKIWFNKTISTSLGIKKTFEKLSSHLNYKYEYYLNYYDKEYYRKYYDDKGGIYLLYDFEIGFNSLQSYIRRSKISNGLFDSLSNNDEIKFNKIFMIDVLKNPLSNKRCLYHYQHTTDQDFIKAIASNPKTPTQILNNMVKNANTENIQLIKNHPNATSFTHQLIQQR